MTHTATALTSWARAIRQALEQSGVDALALFAQAGLDPALMQDPNARYPVAATARLWRLSVAATGDEAFGLRVACCVTPTTFHALGYSLVASPTLMDAFNRLVRYFRIVADAGELRFHANAEQCEFEILPGSTAGTAAPEAIDAFLSVNLRMCRALYGRGLSPLAVHMVRPAPADRAPFERVFRAPLQFSAGENRLIFARAPFDERLAGANPELARHNDAILLRHLARLDRESVANRVHAQLLELLPQGEPSQEKIAGRLNLSLRSLQRRLAAEDTSFKSILNTTRRELALSYIEDPAYPISEVTFLLGFADTSSFSRAFRRWTGQSPVAYRESLRG